MKHILLLLALLLLATPALGDTAEDIARTAHPQAVLSQRMDADGATLLVLTQGQQHTLMLIENGAATVDNPMALLPGDVLPGWSFTCDAVAWTYQLGSEQVRYRAEKLDGCWGNVDVIVTGGEASRIVYVDGLCLRQVAVTGGDRRELTPVPAPWLQGQAGLAEFNADALPLSLEQLPAAAFQPAADLLADGMEVLCGQTCPDGLLLLCDRPNHVSRVLAACVWNEAAGGFQVTRSTPITVTCTAEPTPNGMALTLGACTYHIGRTLTGGWGITAMQLQDGDIELNTQHLMKVGGALQHALWGHNPWSDLTQLDWQSLPRTYTEAAAGVNPAGWAMVNNPDALDTLHLRQNPDAKAYSLGRYYNGAPMQVISSNKDWVQVSIGGVTGWMMKQYVAQDYAMQQVVGSLPMKHVTGAEGEMIPLYADQHGGTTVCALAKGERVLILGFCGDQWYHVLAPEEWAYGYIAMDAVK